MLARKILRQGYYSWKWGMTVSSMSVNAISIKFILIKSINHLVDCTTWLVRGPFQCGVSTQLAWFILVAIDYFTKWVESSSFVNLMKTQVMRFIKNNIICWYGLPQYIITNNAKNLNNDMIDFCVHDSKFVIKIQLLTAPRRMGQWRQQTKISTKFCKRWKPIGLEWEALVCFAL